MKKRRTLPRSLQEWLSGFQSDSEDHPSPKEIRDYLLPGSSTTLAGDAAELSDFDSQLDLFPRWFVA